MHMDWCGGHRLVMKGGDALFSAGAAIGVDSEPLQLLGNAADIGFTNDPARDVVLANDLAAPHAVHRIRALREHHQPPARRDAGQQTVGWGLARQEVGASATLEASCQHSTAIKRDLTASVRQSLRAESARGCCAWNWPRIPRSGRTAAICNQIVNHRQPWTVRWKKSIGLHPLHISLDIPLAGGGRRINSVGGPPPPFPNLLYPPLWILLSCDASISNRPCYGSTRVVHPPC